MILRFSATAWSFAPISSIMSRTFSFVPPCSEPWSAPMAAEMLQ